MSVLICQAADGPGVIAAAPLIYAVGLAMALTADWLDPHPVFPERFRF